MTPLPRNLMLKLGRLLGWDELCECPSHLGSGWLRIVELETGGSDIISDGDLLLAILTRAAEMGYRPSLSENEPTDKFRWDCELGGYQGKQAVLGQSTDPLSAAIAAFIQLPVPA